MQLTKYKYIKNQKPKFDDGKPSNDAQNNGGAANNNSGTANNSGGGFANGAGNWGQAAMGTIQAGMTMYNAFNQPVKSTGNILTDAGQSQGSVEGVGYNRQNSIDAAAEISDAKAQANKEMQSAGLAAGGAGMATGLAVGATIGGTAGPIGAAAGAVIGTTIGLFAGGAAKRRALARLNNKIAVANMKVGRINQFSKSTAQSTAFEQNYMKKYGDPQSGVLYNGNSGKDVKPAFNTGKSDYRKVWDPSGYVNGQHNSWVGKGESLLNFNDGTGTLVTKGKIGVDNQPSSIQLDDDNVILGNDVDWRTGVTFAKQGAPHTEKLQYINNLEKKVGKYGSKSSLSKQTAEIFNRQMSAIKQQTLDDLKQIADRQQEQHDIEHKMNLKKNQHYSALPQFNEADNDAEKERLLEEQLKKEKKAQKWNNITESLQNTLPSIMGVGEGLIRANYANKQRVESPNTYFKNPYAGRALQELASLRYDVNPEILAYQNGMRRSKYAIDQSGGLTAGQKYMARTGMYNDYLNGLSKLYANASDVNNKYRQQYAQALMSQGEEDRKYQTSAARYDNEVYAKAQAARRAMRDQALKDVMENIYRADKRGFDNKVWKQTNDLYKQQLSEQAAQRLADIQAAQETNKSNAQISQTRYGQSGQQGTQPSTSTTLGGNAAYVPYGMNFRYKPGVGFVMEPVQNFFVHKYGNGTVSVK